MEEKIVTILNEMSAYLSIPQMKKLQEVVLKTFSENELDKKHITNEEFLKMFLDAKKIEGCSERTIQYYAVTVEHLLKQTDTEVRKITTEEIRDLAMIDLLYSTGIRVGELVNLNIDDIDLEGRECVVYGKGDKERKVYFDAKAKVHLKEYIVSRNDQNSALFVTLDSPHDRLKISGVEIRLRQLGRSLELDRIHPHKFRRTMATRAIDKGMPIEQVQRILGHSQIDTTMQYAMVNQSNVKSSHQKYMA